MTKNSEIKVVKLNYFLIYFLDNMWLNLEKKNSNKPNPTNNKVITKTYLENSGLIG